MKIKQLCCQYPVRPALPLDLVPFSETGSCVERSSFLGARRGAARRAILEGEEAGCSVRVTCLGTRSRVLVVCAYKGNPHSSGWDTY